MNIESTIRDTFADKRVILRRLSLDLGAEKVTTPHYGLFLPDMEWECIPNAVKKGYHPHTVDDVVALAKAATAAFDGDSQIRCHWRDGHYVEVSPSRDYRARIYGTEDNVFPRMYVRAGYDGMAFSASLGWYRDACSNLSMLQSTGHCTTRKLRHTESLTERIEELIVEFRAVANKWDDTVNTIREMENTQVNLADFIRTVYPQSEDAAPRGVTLHQKRVEAIFSRILNERSKTNRPALTDTNNVLVSGWEAYNGVQGYIQHQSRRKNDNPWDRAILSFSNKDVRRAEEIVLAAA